MPLSYKKMKNKFLFYSVLCLVISTVACSKETVETEPQIKIPFSGKYIWSFSIPLMGTQKSTHVFYADSVFYKMEGQVYNTSYMQLLHSYDTTQHKLISIGRGGSIPKNGVYFVMFFKDITDTSVSIYKHECSNGESEALNFQRPADNATADYGWNVYYKED